LVAAREGILTRNKIGGIVYLNPPSQKVAGRRGKSMLFPSHINVGARKRKEDKPSEKKQLSIIPLL